MWKWGGHTAGVMAIVQVLRRGLRAVELQESVPQAIGRAPRLVTSEPRVEGRVRQGTSIAGQ